MSRSTPPGTSLEVIDLEPPHPPPSHAMSPIISAHMELAQFTIASRHSVWQQILPTPFPSSGRARTSKPPVRFTPYTHHEHTLRYSAAKSPLAQTNAFETTTRMDTTPRTPSPDCTTSCDVQQGTNQSIIQPLPTAEDITSTVTRGSSIQPRQTTSPLSTRPLIPKPEGENGRPGRGGYSVAAAVKLDANAFKELKVRLRLPSSPRSFC